MSEYVNVKPRRAFVHTMKEVKLESMSNDEQKPTKRSKSAKTILFLSHRNKMLSLFCVCVCVTGKMSEPDEIDETEHHLDDDEDFAQPMNESELVGEHIEELPDDRPDDPLENKNGLTIGASPCDEMEYVEPPLAVSSATMPVLLPVYTSTPVLPNISPAKPSSCVSAPEHRTSSPPLQKKADEFDIFGNFVGQVMKNMPKSKARLLQMKFLQLITEYDE